MRKMEKETNLRKSGFENCNKALTDSQFFFYMPLSSVCVCVCGLTKNDNIFVVCYMK